MKNLFFGAVILFVLVGTATALGTRIGDRLLVGFLKGVLLLPLIVLTAAIAFIDMMRICRYVKHELSKSRSWRWPRVFAKLFTTTTSSRASGRKKRCGKKNRVRTKGSSGTAPVTGTGAILDRGQPGTDEARFLPH